MAKAEKSRATVIKSMVRQLESGLDRKDILGKFRKSSEIPKSSLYDWFKEAESKHNEKQKRLRPIKEKAEEDAVYEATKESVKAGVLTELERKIYLSEFIRANISRKKEVVTNDGIQSISEEPTFSDRVKSIDLLNKMDRIYEANDSIEDSDITEITITEL